MDTGDCCAAPPEAAPRGPDHCPRCGTRGPPVTALTIASLVRSSVRSGLDSLDGFRFCSERSCDLAYYRPAPGAQVPRGALIVHIGTQKSRPPRTLCYCFDHTFEALEAEVRATGASSVPDSIMDMCKRGLDRCEETNPKGSCCLGEVRAEVRRLQDAAARARQEQAR